MPATFLIAAVLAAGTYAHPEQLVETEWLAAHSADPGIRVVDMRRAGYDEGHVPQAVYLAPDAIRVADSPPTFLPTPEAFKAMMEKAGISDNTRVIVYDESGIYAPRLWWILNYFGHSNVAIVNGGWRKWALESRPTTAAPTNFAWGSFTPRAQPQWLATASDVVAAIDKPDRKIVDARTNREINGATQPNIKRGGFVPSAIPVYYEDLLDPEWRTFKSADEIAQIYQARGILPSHEVIVYCLVGMRASVDIFALRLIGYDKLKNYYGAWEEWGNRDDLPLGRK
ncbi:MAG TPA: sulfurtransferase [Vicinamibacterales bacterium]|jgi:thiosulfate/3-mercaptopyruvate sulfurtransferase|nr:sulfurtransferase [Vicinamibacterales bacterium]